MKISILFFLAALASSCAQIKYLDQEYYSVIKKNTLEFKQVKDSLFISRCRSIGQCDSIKKFSYLIVKDSTINMNKVKLILSGSKYDNTLTHKRGLTLIDYEDGRKGVRESFVFGGKERVRYITLYPKSELQGLKPISEISKIESEQILTELVDHLKLNNKKGFDWDDPRIWKFYTNLVIKKGYNPIGASREIGSKTD